MILMRVKYFCLLQHQDYQLPQILDLEIFVSVAADASVSVSKLAPLIQAEPGHKMCHLHRQNHQGCELFVDAITILVT